METDGRTISCICPTGYSGNLCEVGNFFIYVNVEILINSVIIFNFNGLKLLVKMKCVSIVCILIVQGELLASITSRCNK